MAKGKLPPFMAKKKAPPVPQTAKIAREAKSEGEPYGVEQQEMAQGLRRGGKIRRK